MGFDAVFCHGYNRFIWTLTPLLTMYLLLKFTIRLTFLKILTGSNMYAGTYKTDTYENMSISILSQYSKPISVQTSMPSYLLYTMLPPP
jgi:hypothetical protein